MRKVDLKKKYEQFYSEKKGNISILEVPSFNYLICDGEGNPNTSTDYKNAIEAIFSLSYKLKFNIKKGREIDYGVMPLEALWWMDNMKEFTYENIDKWRWCAMIMQPNFITKELVREAMEELSQQKELLSLPKLELIEYTDGLSAQIMHLGPHADEAPTIEKLHAYIHEQGYELRGKHREIYLNDPQRTAPENLKTIIRQPIAKPYGLAMA